MTCLNNIFQYYCKLPNLSGKNRKKFQDDCKQIFFWTIFSGFSEIFKEFGDFLEDLDIEAEWDLLLLLEFTGGKYVDDFMNATIHAVILAPPAEGSRASGIVINRRIRHCMLHGSETYKSRATSVGIHWEGWNLQVISAHLCPYNNRQKIMQTV